MSLIDQLNLMRRRIVYEGEDHLTEEYLSRLEHARDDAFATSAAEYQTKVDSIASSYRTLHDLEELHGIMLSKKEEANTTGETRYRAVLQQLLDEGLLGEAASEKIGEALDLFPGVVKALIVTSIGSALLMYMEMYTGKTTNLRYSDLLLSQEEQSEGT